jgi:precorrin-2 dehydrogenase/sirohydrochlorin ferrochelatase
MIINLNLEGKKIIVVGGGNEAEKRIKPILNEKCEIIVISDSINIQISKLVKTKNSKCKIYFRTKTRFNNYNYK